MKILSILKKEIQYKSNTQLFSLLSIALGAIAFMIIYGITPLNVTNDSWIMAGYDENDISGSIAIVRNAHTIVGLNSTEQEEKDDILRCELVVQRDGLPSGRALFKCDVERQRCVEFTKEQRKQYDELYSDTLDKIMKGQKGNPDANEEKYNKKQGDI